jgi:hypothetical protein
MTDDDRLLDFALGYTSEKREAIRFAWNGKHPNEFHDENQEFRGALAQLTLSRPDAIPLPLVRDIFLEDAAWSAKAWCAPHHFAGLLSILLERGGREYLQDFATAMNATFDTFGAAHEVTSSEQQAHGLLEETERQLLAVTDARRRSEMESAKQLFHKLIRGNATEGWFMLRPGTPVRNIRVVRPATKDDRAIPRASSLRDRLRRFFHRE